MWQTILVLLIVGTVVIYLVRHYARAARGGGSACSSCDCRPAGPRGGNTPGGCAGKPCPEKTREKEGAPL